MFSMKAKNDLLTGKVAELKPHTEMLSNLQ